MTLAAPIPVPDAIARMRQLASAVVWQETLGKAKKPIATFNDKGACPPFYCVHSLSGKATDYSQLSLMLGPDQPFHALQIPMANRDENFGAVGEVTIPAIATFYADAICAFQADGPLALGGWSVGAVLALEIARQLRARGRVVTLLVAFDLAPWDATAINGLRWAKFANLPSWLLHHRLLHKPSFSTVCNALLAKLGLKARSHAGVPTLGTDIAVSDLVDPAHYPPAHGVLMTKLLQASMEYRAARYNGPVQVYVARREVPLVHLPLLTAAWRKVAPNLRITPACGTHRKMIEDPEGQAMAADLREQLVRAGQRQSS